MQITRTHFHNTTYTAGNKEESKYACIVLNHSLRQLYFMYVFSSVMAQTRTPKCHTGSLYSADIMSATRSSTVWITRTATDRGLTVATTDGPVEAARLQDAGVRWHETRGVHSKRNRSRVLRLLVGVFRNPRVYHVALIGGTSLNKELLWTQTTVTTSCRKYFFVAVTIF